MQTIKNKSIHKNQTKKQSHKTRQKTYYCGYSKYMPKLVREKFEGWQELTIDDAFKNQKCDFILLDGWDMFDKRFWYVSSIWKGRITAPLIVNKYLLHQAFAGADFLPQTVFVGKMLPRIQFASKNDIWIWRTDNKEGRNKDVAVITNYPTLVSQYNDFIKSKLHISKFSVNALLTRYIINPDLIEHDRKKYKYHIRIYYIVVVEENEKRAGVYHKGEIPLAQDPYKPTDFTNRRIHETHFSYNNVSGISKIFSENNYKNYKKVNQQIIDILSVITKKTIGSIEKNKESYINFQIFGCDFLVDEQLKVWLLEINNSPAIREIDWLQNMLLNGLFEFVINYHPENELKEIKKL